MQSLLKNTYSKGKCGFNKRPLYNLKKRAEANEPFKVYWKVKERLITWDRE